jgi:hypothetical protein
MPTRRRALLVILLLALLGLALASLAGRAGGGEPAGVTQR